MALLRPLVIPSIPFINTSLFKYIANHPLITKPLVRHPITDDLVLIDKFRLYSGLNTEGGLICSIYPYGKLEDGELIRPAAINTSAYYQPYSMGNEHDEATYNFIVEFALNEVLVPESFPVNDPAINRTPDNGIVYPADRFTVQIGQKEVDLEISPSVYVLGEYLELVRLVISDKEYRPNFPIPVSSMEVMSIHIPPKPWHKEGIFFHSAYLIVCLKSFISRTWRDKLRPRILDISVDTVLETDPRLVEYGLTFNVPALDTQSIVVTEPSSSPSSLANLQEEQRPRFNFSWQSPASQPLVIIASNKTVVNITIVVEEAFNGAISNISVRDNNNNQLVSSSRVDLAQELQFEVNPNRRYIQPNALYLDLDIASNCTQGSGFLLIEIH